MPTVFEDFKKAKLTKSCVYFKMKKIDNLKAKAADKRIKDLIDKDAVLKTDDSTPYANFEVIIDVHITEVPATQKGKFNLKWAHKAISNLKSDLIKYRFSPKESSRITLKNFVINSTEDILEKGFSTDRLLRQFNPT